MIHGTAIICPSAVMGDRITIHPYAIVGASTRIGHECTLGHGAVVETGAIIHDSVAVWDYAKVRSNAEVEDGVGIGHGSIINVGVRIGRKTRIQNHVSIPTGVCVGPFVFIGPGAKFPNDKHPRAFGSWTAGRTIVETGASIGANATVVCGEETPTVVGAFAMLMAGTTACKSILPFGLYRGNERRGWVNTAGHTVSRDPYTLPESVVLVAGCDDETVQSHARRAYDDCLEQLKRGHP